jgi:hypothetical protein
MCGHCRSTGSPVSGAFRRWFINRMDVMIGQPVKTVETELLHIDYLADRPTAATRQYCRTAKVHG